MRTATNYFIVNLAVGDILMALLCIPFTVLSNYIFQYWPFGYSLCVIVSYAQANSVFIRFVFNNQRPSHSWTSSTRGSSEFDRTFYLRPRAKSIGILTL